MPQAGRTRFQERTAEPIPLIVGADRIALCGRFPRVAHHQHAAPAIVVGIDGPLEFEAGKTHESRAALIAPGFAHAVEARGGRLAMFVLPTHAVSRQGLLPVRDLPHARSWVELGEAMLQGRVTSFDLVDETLASAHLDLAPIDDRLRRALEVLAEALDENLPVHRAAAAAGLSPSRLMAIARMQLGGSLRAYRRWLRAFRVARDYAKGASLTEAALAAGFASSAHLSAAAREHFGIRPSDILAPHNRPAIATFSAASSR
jgi:AraC-like DNA-binding protein